MSYVNELSNAQFNAFIMAVNYVAKGKGLWQVNTYLI